jgi:uroporphyrinogen III methyltransferase/synthase
VYETEECALRDVTNEEIDYVTFTSASTVRGFMEGHKNINKDAFTAVCIGETTAAEAQRYGLNCITAAEARIDSMIKLITEDIK